MDDEVARNWALVRTPLGEPWSGRTRYGAAVFLYNCGEMEPEVLEVYRICSRLDAEDPLAIIRDWGIGKSWLKKVDTAAG